MENAKCDGGQLWEGNVQEPSSLNQRISECKRKCDDHPQCKFIFVNELNDWCRIHSSCDTITSTNGNSINLAKRGMSLFVAIIRETIKLIDCVGDVKRLNFVFHYSNSELRMGYLGCLGKL